MKHYTNVYESQDSQVVVARVRLNQNLDKKNRNGRLCHDDREGFHGGLTKLKKVIDGKSFVFISCSDYQYPDKAWLMNDGEALAEILKSDNEDLLSRYFPNFELDEEI